MVVMAGSRLKGRRFDSPIYFSLLFFFLFSISFFPLYFSFRLAPPFQCSSIFLVIANAIYSNWTGSERDHAGSEREREGGEMIEKGGEERGERRKVIMTQCNN